MIIIGVDPDSKAHGVAVYEKGRLIALYSMALLDFNNLLDEYEGQLVEVHIENVCANNAVFMKSTRGSKAMAEAKARGRTLGMCQQAQIELERVMNSWCNVEIVKHKISKVWKKDKAQFEKVTGWKGRSNEDTRSAAYFGFLGISSK